MLENTQAGSGIFNLRGDTHTPLVLRIYGAIYQLLGFSLMVLAAILVGWSIVVFIGALLNALTNSSRADTLSLPFIVGATIGRIIGILIAGLVLYVLFALGKNICLGNKRSIYILTAFAGLIFAFNIAGLSLLRTSFTESLGLVILAALYLPPIIVGLIYKNDYRRGAEEATESCWSCGNRTASRAVACEACGALTSQERRNTAAYSILGTIALPTAFVLLIAVYLYR